MKKTKVFGLLAGSLVALATISIRAHAQAVESGWGDLGYTQPVPQVEAISESLSDEAGSASTRAPEAQIGNNDDIKLPDSESVSAKPVKRAEVKSEEIPNSKPRRSFTNLSTVENTYGVMTEEKSGISLYISPFAGSSSVIGNDTADNNPQYAVGASAGLLISSNMLLEISYVHAEQNFSNPRINTTQGVYVNSDANVFALKQNVIDAGIKLFILGRESRIRPFLGGGMGYSRGTLNYTTPYQQALANQAVYLSDFSINQYNGFGELGAEFAITRNIVATGSFRLHGVLGSSTSGDSAPLNYDPSKLDVGNSLSRTASYLISAGLGIYF